MGKFICPQVSCCNLPQRDRALRAFGLQNILLVAANGMFGLPLAFVQNPCFIFCGKVGSTHTFQLDHRRLDLLTEPHVCPIAVPMRFLASDILERSHKAHRIVRCDVPKCCNLRLCRLGAVPWTIRTVLVIRFALPTKACFLFTLSARSCKGRPERMRLDKWESEI